jgi:hypothetical protein
VLNLRQSAIVSVLGMLGLVALSGDVAGQSLIPAGPSKFGHAAPFAFAWPPLPPDATRPSAGRAAVGTLRPAQASASRDTVANGAIIGAVVGAVAVGGFGAFVCKLQQEEGGASCLPDVFRVAAIGAAIGAGAGLVIDAALTRHAGVTVRVGLTF